jgi:hypothetical protein
VPARNFFRRLAFVIAGVLSASPASAQQRPNVELSPIEVALGISINALFQDVNAAPTCLELSLPCTHSRPNHIGGFGLGLSVARPVNGNLAIVSDLSAFENDWSSPDSMRNHMSARTRVTSIVIGPRVSTDFFYAGRDPQPGRFFGQVLLGAEMSNEGTLRPSVIVGGGTDVLMARGASRGVAPGPPVDLTLRMALDYRLSPGAGRNFSGWRFTLGFVFGPHLKI